MIDLGPGAADEGGRIVAKGTRKWWPTRPTRSPADTWEVLTQTNESLRRVSPCYGQLACLGGSTGGQAASGTRRSWPTWETIVLTHHNLMRPTPKSFRLHIGLFGRRNVGKSSVLNAMTRQQVSIVSDVAGTTTDPVEKPMELLPIGPVLFIDTAGVDDVGALGQARVEKTRQVFDRTDVGILVAEAGQWGEFEERVLAELRGRQAPVIVAWNKSDLSRPDPRTAESLSAQRTPCVETVATTGEGMLAPARGLDPGGPGGVHQRASIISDLVPPGELVVLVVPIDKEAPKGD